MQYLAAFTLPEISTVSGRFFTPLSFHFDASVWWWHSKASLTFPIKLAQCGSGLLISHNATTTVVASADLGLPLSSTSPSRLIPHSCSFFSSLSILLRWTVQPRSMTHSLVKSSWTVARSPMLFWLFLSLKSKWTEIAKYVLTSFKVRANENLKTHWHFFFFCTF